MWPILQERGGHGQEQRSLAVCVCVCVCVPPAARPHNPVELTSQHNRTCRRMWKT